MSQAIAVQYKVWTTIKVATSSIRPVLQNLGLDMSLIGLSS